MNVWSSRIWCRLFFCMLYIKRYASFWSNRSVFFCIISFCGHWACIPGLLMRCKSCQKSINCVWQITFSWWYSLFNNLPIIRVTCLMFQWLVFLSSCLVPETTPLTPLATSIRFSLCLLVIVSRKSLGVTHSLLVSQSLARVTHVCPFFSRKRTEETKTF